MKRRIFTVAGALASVVALVAVPSALAAYTSPKLEVRQAGNAVIVKVSQTVEDDATAAAQILAPDGTSVTTTQAPGTVLGQVQALVIATALNNTQLPIEGQIIVTAPGQVPAAQVAACLQGDTPTAIWLMALSAAGQAINVPMYLVVADGAAIIVVCLPHPSTATFGAKLISAEFSVTGVFSNTPGIWAAAWLPYGPTAQPNPAGTVISPAANLRGAVTAVARKRGRLGATVTGRVTQGGTVTVEGATVTIFGGTRANRLRRVGRVRTNANGAYTFRARTGTFFRANTVVTPGDAPFVCEAIAADIAPIPCVNPTINGFTAQSRVARKR
jgi:hypothetical protein